MHTFDRTDEIRDLVVLSILENVAARAGLEKLARVATVRVQGQHEHGAVGYAAAEIRHQIRAAVGHRGVYHDDVWLERARRAIASNLVKQASGTVERAC